MPEISAPIGPVLYLDHVADGVMHLASLFIMPQDEAPGPFAIDSGQTASHVLVEYDRATIWRAWFKLPADWASRHRWDRMDYPVAVI